jgi:hypothetical protein
MSGRRTLRLVRRLRSAASLLAAALPGLAAKPEFGRNVLVLDPSMPSQAIQKQINAVYGTQQHNEFGPQPNGLLFLPGSYPVDVPVGFCTEVMGPVAIRSRHHKIPISRIDRIEEALWNRMLDWYGHDSLVTKNRPRVDATC